PYAGLRNSAAIALAGIRPPTADLSSVSAADPLQPFSEGRGLRRCGPADPDREPCAGGLGLRRRDPADSCARRRLSPCPLLGGRRPHPSDPTRILGAHYAMPPGFPVRGLRTGRRCVEW